MIYNLIVNNLLNPVYSIQDSVSKEIILSFDSIIDCNFQASSEITSIPLENGFQATEYKYKNSNSVEIKGVISKSSILFNNALSKTKLTKNKDEFIKNTIKTLEKYNDNLIPVNITSKVSVYQGYTLKKYSIEENKDNFGIFEVLMNFEEILLTKKGKENFKNATDKPTVKLGIIDKIKLNFK